MKQLSEKIITVIKEKSPRIVAIDGRCASGKTTLSAAIAEKLDCPVVHLDHFFLRPHQRTEERLSVPGGNIDYERLIEEVFDPLLKLGECNYRPYSCASGEFLSPIHVKIPQENNLVIFEGSYSCHPMLWEYYDLRIFIDIQPELQTKRIIERDGLEKSAMFRSKWIPLEEKYFKAFDIKKRCDYAFET